MMQNDNATNDEPIISDTFRYFKSNKEIKVNLYSDCLKIYANDTKNSYALKLQKMYSMADVVGCSLGKGPVSQDTKSYLTIYAYPKYDVKTSRRKRETVTLEYSKFDTYQRNLEAIKEWSVKLNKILSKDSSGAHENIVTLPPSSASSAVYTKEKPFLVFVNPTSGAGKAKNIFFERILPVWSEANIPYVLVLTKYQNHAREQVGILHLNDYKGIIVVSGDGLVFEVLNGIMDREDCLEAIKTPIGQIPGGSGNALACCVAYLAKEAFLGLSLEKFAMHMSFLTCKHDVLPMDLTAIDIGGTDECLRTPMPAKRIYAFLTTEWAIVADVDYESEKYRYLGGFRFVVGAVKRIMDLRIYRGRVSFLPADDCKDYKPKNPQIKILTNESSPDGAEQQSDTPRVKLKYLRPFHEPVPKDWLTIEENFAFFLVAQLPLIAKDFNAWPDAKLDDGQMLLIYIKEGITKMQLLQLFTDTESGHYLQSPFVESVRIKAFRLEPFTKNGNIMIDGEKIPYGPIQGEVIPSLGNCIAKRIESI